MIGKSVKGVPERQYSELAWDNKQSAAIKLGKSSRTDREPVTRMSDIPWVLVVDEMVLNITAGAVIQHLAKFRTRMVEQGLSVPPPPRVTHGGGSDAVKVYRDSNTNGEHIMAGPSHRSTKRAAKKAVSELSCTGRAGRPTTNPRASATGQQTCGGSTLRTRQSSQ